MSRDSRRHLHSGCGESLHSDLLQPRNTTLLRKAGIMENVVKHGDMENGIRARKPACPEMAAPVKG
jgi:hypothetical protein